jgi:hypothetical protein
LIFNDLKHTPQFFKKLPLKVGDHILVSLDAEFDADQNGAFQLSLLATVDHNGAFQLSLLE